ncbi:MAG: HlyD family secretion protein [Candidatus Rokubacteria bacterium]|nr:HlyD family secretion protein [Candidatus Rokubacteria bacterium]
MTPEAELSQPVPRRARPSAWRRLASGVAVLVLASGVGYGAWLWQYWQTHVSTDDAFVEARIAPVSAKVRGIVREVLVADNAAVRAGDVLVRLDPPDYEVQVEQARAAVLIAEGEEKKARAGVRLTDESTDSLVRQAEAALQASHLEVEVGASALEERRGGLRARQATVAAAGAAVAGASAGFEKARLDRERMEKLAREGLVAQQEFDHADAAFKSAQATLESTRKQLEQAEAEAHRAEAEVRSQLAAVERARQLVEERRAHLANARSRRREVALQHAEAEAARGRLARARAGLHEAELRLADTVIRAPADGRVTKKTVEVGQVVQPGQLLMAIVSREDVWIIANYKETQLTHVRPDQPATVTVDSYPGLVLKARVDSIQTGTGTRFSLLPPENASGNFVKVVQRIPVKLVLEPAQTDGRLLVPGMSAVPTIKIR